MSDRPSEPLSPGDLGMWWADQPRQRTTMAMLMCLDGRPDRERLRAAAWRAVEAVPRLRQRVVDAPFDLSLPRWEDDPTFDLDFHVRRYSLPGEVPEASALEALLATVGPIYERPFDRSRPLWELIEIEAPRGRAAAFFKLHHAVADGVGGNAVLAALTDSTREGEPLPPPPDKAPGGWQEPGTLSRLGQAALRRVGEDLDRARGVAGAVLGAVRHPSALLGVGNMVGVLAEDLGHRSESPLRSFGRSRHLAALDLDFGPLRAVRRRLGGRMVSVLLTGLAGAMAEWHRSHGMGEVEELLTLVPINVRPDPTRTTGVSVGNRASGINVRLPLDLADPVERFHVIQDQVQRRMEHAAAGFFEPVMAALTALPRPLFRSVAFNASKGIDFIVTNVPGLPVARYLAGAEITAGYPFAPVAPHCPVSVALYGYRGRLYVGLDADGSAMPDLDVFRGQVADAFEELFALAGDD